MSHILGGDSICKGARSLSHPSFGKSGSHENSYFGSSSNAFRIKSRLNGLMLRSCFDSNKLTADKKAGAVARYLVGDTDARLVNGRGSSQTGSPLGFRDNTLPEKIVVAVDVDEGIIYQCLFSFLFGSEI